MNVCCCCCWMFGWLYKRTVFQLDRCDKFLEKERKEKEEKFWSETAAKLQSDTQKLWGWRRRRRWWWWWFGERCGANEKTTTAFQVAEIFMVVANGKKKSIEEISGQLEEEWRGDGQIAAAVFVFVYQRAEENSLFSVFNSSELFSLINRWIGQQFSVCDCSGEEEEERKRKWQREERELAADRFICLYLPVCCLEFNAPN